MISIAQTCFDDGRKPEHGARGGLLISDHPTSVVSLEQSQSSLRVSGAQWLHAASSLQARVPGCQSGEGLSEAPLKRGLAY